MMARRVAPAGAILAVMCAGMFLVLLDVTVVNVALPSIAEQLRADAAGAQWIVDAYAVTIAALLLAGGTVGDRVGHRRVVLTGLAVFGVASAVCGLAPSTGALVAARAGQGLGAALLLPGTLAVITEAYPQRAARARALGIWAGVSSLALPAGPLVGGLLVAAGGWRWVFLVNLPVVLVALIATPAVVPRSPRSGGDPIDLAGIVLAATGLGALVFAVIDLSHSGIHAPGVGVAAVAAVALVGLIVRERRARAPMLPPELVMQPAFLGPNLAGLLMNMVINGSLFVTTLYLQHVLGHAPLTAGLALLPLFVPLAGLAPLVGRITARVGPRPPLLAGGIIALLGASAFTLVEPTRGYLALMPALLGLGIGAGLFTAPVVTAAVSAAPTRWSGRASGVNNTARQTGTALGVAVFGAVAPATAPAARFVAGLHALAAVGVGLWLAALVLVTTTVRAAGTGGVPRETS